MRVRSLGIVVIGACVAAVLAADAQAAPPPHAASPFEYAVPKAGSRALFSLSRYPTSLVEIARSGATTALLRSRGGTLAIPQLNVWQLPTGTAQELTPRLERTGVLEDIEPQHTLSFYGHLDPPDDLLQGDPMIPQEWWIPVIGMDTSEAPGPGIWSVTDVDSGLDITHPEFADRPDTTLLNPQSVTDTEEWHGTAVSSVAAAPANGIGVVGVYPQTAYRMWDASPNGELTVASEVKGILAAAADGPTVINLSLGSDSPSQLEEQAVLRAFGSGSLVVAAAGNFRTSTSNPLEYPASYPHVLTVAATRQSGGLSASWSSSSAAVDLAAPGVSMPVAVPLATDPSGYLVADGTSFSTPLVSGAAAWVANMRPGMNVTQLFQLMRSSAQDIPPAGRDNKTGYGLLSIPAALAAPIPPADPQEPNDDIAAVKANGLFRAAKTPLSVATPLHATLDGWEDPEDVYRIVVPALKTVKVTTTASAQVSLGLWGPLTKTVFEKGAAEKRDLLVYAAKPGSSTQTVTYTNTLNRNTTLYVDVWLASKAIRGVSYSLRVVDR